MFCSNWRLPMSMLSAHRNIHPKTHSHTLVWCVIDNWSFACCHSSATWRRQPGSGGTIPWSYTGVTCVCVCVCACVDSNVCHCLMILLQPTLSLSFLFLYSPSPPTHTHTHTHRHTHTHTHTYRHTHLTPLRINMCNSGEILHHHGNRASCPMEGRAAKPTVWFLSHLLPSAASFYEFSAFFFFFFFFFCVWMLMTRSRVAVNIPLLNSAALFVS